MRAIIYKITYPNGKIYVGKDETNTITYFGSANKQIVAADFTDEQRVSFTVTRTVLWQSENASRAEVNKKEVDFIRQLQSNNPAVGYNRWPRSWSDEDTLSPRIE